MTPPEALEIGPPNPDDFASMARVHKNSYVATYTGVTPDITSEAVDFHLGGDWLERMESRYQDRYSSGESASVVARTGGAIVGFCMANYDLEGGALYIEPDYQGGLVGPALIWAIRNTVIDRGFKLTVVPNTPAVTFYKRLGFTQSPALVNPAFLRGGQALPQLELSIDPEAVHGTIQRLGRLLERRDGLIFIE